MKLRGKTLFFYNRKIYTHIGFILVDFFSIHNENIQVNFAFSI